MVATCPVCGAAISVSGSRCARCGAPLDRAGKATEHLLEGLEELSRAADEAVGKDSSRSVDEVLGELESFHREIARTEPLHSDRTEFVQRVEAPRGESRGNARRPRRDRFAPSFVTSGALIAAGGLVLATSEFTFGVALYLAGVGVIVIGLGLYRSPHPTQ